MAKKITYIKQTGDKKVVKLGFYWTIFFFGWIGMFSNGLKKQGFVSLFYLLAFSGGLVLWILVPLNGLMIIGVLTMSTALSAMLIHSVYISAITKNIKQKDYNEKGFIINE